MKKNEALNLIFTGERIQAKEWSENQYIEVVDGQVVDEKGKPFDLMSSKLEEWAKWVEPVKKGGRVEVVDKAEALKALYSGERVRSTEWVASYIEVIDGQVVDEKGKPFDLMSSKLEEWAIGEYVEEVSKDSEIAELKDMVKQLLEKKSPDARASEAQTKTTAMLQDVYGVSTPAKVVELFKSRLEEANNSRDVEKAVCEFIPFCWIGKGSINTVKNIYTDMRKVIGGLKNETYKEIALELFKPTQTLYESSSNKVNEAKKEKIRHKNTFDAKPIYEGLKSAKDRLVRDMNGEPDVFDDKARQTTIERERAYYIYSYLTVVTGRRQVEVLSTMDIVKDKNSVTGWSYTGVAKGREEGKTVDAYALDDDFEFLKKILDELHKHIGKVTKGELNSKYNNPFNNALKRLTNTSLTAKDWRAIFTEMMWLKSGKKGSNIDKRDFRAMVLGHEYDPKLSATEHYEDWEAIENE